MGIIFAIVLLFIICYVIYGLTWLLIWLVAYKGNAGARTVIGIIFSLVFIKLLLAYSTIVLVSLACLAIPIAYTSKRAYEDIEDLNIGLDRKRCRDESKRSI